jgi:hypothetical protein
MAKSSHFRELRVWQGGMDLEPAPLIDRATVPGKQLYALRNALNKRK